MRRAVHCLCAALLVAVLGPLAGCDALEDEARDQARETATQPTVQDEGAQPPPVERARCPAGVSGCRSASGTIIYVERVDPDGDGDAHFVLASDEGITAEELSVIDVRRDLRPDPLPREGDRLSAAGPVHRGSFGQRQIEAVVVRAAYTARK